MFLNLKHNANVLWPLLLEAVSDNVLPLTSSCNLKCIFCSNRSNPPGIKSFSFPPLSEETVDELIPLLDPERKIVIGESTTRLCEGEPLTHPLFMQIIKKIKDVFPHTTVQVTTNGALLNEDLVKQPGIELMISLNSSSPYWRRESMGDETPEKALEAVNLCKNYGVDFHGSIVAIPHFTGWEDVRETLHYLEKSGALTSRVFLPGVTRYSPWREKFSALSWMQLYNFITEIKKELDHPVILEPPLKKDLLARVEGVVADSPAKKVGIETGDVIKRIEGETALTAVDAFYTVKKMENPLLEIKRCFYGIKGRFEEYLSLRLEKKAGESPGIITSYDLEPLSLRKVNSEIKRCRSTQPLLFTSVLAAPLWEAARLDALLPEELSICQVKSNFWGGTISCAGLLTVDDFKAAIINILQGERDPDLLILPLSPFDQRGEDLVGKNYSQLIHFFPQVALSFL